MKRLLLVLAMIAFFILAFFAWFWMHYPEVGPPPLIEIEATSERIERGRYLANHVAACIHCHSQRDDRYYVAPIIAGTEGGGGDHFGRDEGFPGDVYVSNITPHALDSWTDGELLRAITTGVNPDGSVSFPLMPYVNYGILTESDAMALVAYLRTLTPVENEIPVGKISFPLNYIMKTIPRDATPVTPEELQDQLDRGKYLTTIGLCDACHTPSDRGAPIPEMAFAGGFLFQSEAGTLRSPNITPDVETGIGSWTEEMFIQRFHSYKDSSALYEPAGENGMVTVMPWESYADMTREDLAAIYAYLRSINPVNNPVEQD